MARQRFVAFDLGAESGRAVLGTLEGGKLEAAMQGSQLVLKDEKGNIAIVTIPNVMQSNGVIHVVDAVLLP